MKYKGDGWVAYDRRFRQIAATAPRGLWVRRDVDLWNMVFQGAGADLTASTALVLPTGQKIAVEP